MQQYPDGIKLTEEEHIKKAGLSLDFDAIALKGTMSKEEVLIAKWYGIYRSRQKGDHMVRVVIPGGDMTTTHIRTMARLANRYAAGKISFTTRQSAQYHKVSLNAIPELLRELNNAGLTTFHGAGDVPRNVTACPWAGVCKHRRFDVMPYTKQTAKLLSGSRDLDNLPRKYKVTFSGCAAGCGQPLVNCCGAIAIVRRNAQGVEETGFRVLIGGGMGSEPYIAKQLYSFIPAASIMAVARAVGLLFNEQGDRTNRKRARLKYVVDQLGIEKCRQLLQAVYQREGVDASDFETADIRDCGPDIPTRPLRDANPVDKNGLCIQRMMLAKGEVTAANLERIADLAEHYADGHVYSTNRQNLELHAVNPSRHSKLQKELQTIGLLSKGFYGLPDIVTCVGTTYCPMAFTGTHELYKRLAERVSKAKYEPIRNKVLINITGCPNSCGQYYIADIGLRGLRIHEQNGSVEGYEIRIGGTQHEFGNVLGDFKIDDCEAVVECILETFMKVCQEEDYDSLAAHVCDKGHEIYQDRINTL